MAQALSAWLGHQRLTIHPQFPQGAPLNEADHCGDPPLLLAAGNGAIGLMACRVGGGGRGGPALIRASRLAGACPSTPHMPAAGHLAVCKLLVEEGADLEQRNVVSDCA